MKNWFASSRLTRGLLVSSQLLGAGSAWGASLADGRACLEASDLPCASAAAATAGESPDAQAFRAEVTFARAEFAEALRLMELASAARPSDEQMARTLKLYRATVEATDGFVTSKRGDVEIRYLPGTDLVLVDEAFEALQAAHDRIGPLLGGAPPGGVRMEIYPTAERFTKASGLPTEAVQTTGVVALSKWTRLLVTSPRALGRGYAWKDTIAHEYIHYIVAWRTKDQAPVWLQEGIARSHESLWNQDQPPALQPYQQSLLAEALAGDKLVPLERMHPSMAFLDSADEAALAFAQVSTMMVHLRAVAGTDAVSKVLDRVRKGTDALKATAEVGTAGDVGAFMTGWRTMLADMHLVRRKLAAMPTVLGPGEDDFGIDPVLATRRDLAGHARLGDLLREADRAEASLVEYRKAIPEGEPAPPTLSSRMAEALLTLGRTDEALATLRASVNDYPEYATTRKSLGGILLSQGKAADALVQFRASADINPFDPDVQSALADLYTSLGDATLAARHARYRGILALGGATPGAKSPGSRGPGANGDDG
ncbi:MAG: tetratricopeptide repeat protein [Myxococcota bacterium]